MPEHDALGLHIGRPSYEQRGPHQEDNNNPYNYQRNTLIPRQKHEFQ